MDATTMEKITSLAKKLLNKARATPHLSDLTLKEGEIFGWDHTACAITYAPAATNANAYLLHEFGHALLNHASYKHDVDLIKMERAAWDEACHLGRAMGVTIHDNLVEDSIDTYRDWLHNRSLCPNCSATGVQATPDSYQCVACHTTWRVNEARTCGLKRYATKNAR